MEKLLIIDGNSIINRAFYGIRLLTNSKGMYTNAIYGFLNIMLKHMEDISPRYVAVAFDLKAPTFRHKMYDKYKAQRKGMPDELKMQMPVMKEILSAMNVTILEKEGFEADDIIGTVSRMCKDSEVECFVLTGDKDDLQLATDTTKILLTVTKGGTTTTQTLDSDDIWDIYGVTPKQFVDVKGLMGDSSDNVPGVKGIGEKTAFEYIKKFGSIENLYDNLDDSIVKPAARQKLIDGRDMAYLSKKLCTIDTNVDLDFEIADALVKEYDTERLAEIYINLEFSVFLKKLSQNTVTQTESKKVCTLADAHSCMEYLSLAGDTLVYKLFKGTEDMGALAFLSRDTVYFAKDTYPNIAEVLKSFVGDKNICKVSSDIKEDMVFLDKHGVEMDDNYFDISVGAYIINPLKNSYDVSDIAMDFLSLGIKEDKEIFGSGKNLKTILNIDETELLSYLGTLIPEI